MKEKPEIGAYAEISINVTAKEVITFSGGGAPPVYSTPSMIDLMELTSHKVLEPYLEEGENSVGTQVEVKHLAATPIGMKVTVNSKLTGIDGRKCVFQVEAFDEKEKIGEGTHERFIIDVERFASRVKDKIKS